MPILDTPPNPVETPQSTPPARIRTGRYAALEEHELIHLLDSVDDEVARARFRESIYKSIIICMAIAWFLFYGPRYIFHQPEYKDLISAMKEHDKQITYLETPPAIPRVAPKAAVPDRKTLQQLQKQARATPVPPSPQAAPQPTTAAPPQETARVATPTQPVAQPLLPAAPMPSRPQQVLPDAPKPLIANNTPSAHDAIQQAIQGSRTGRTGAEYSSGGRGSAGPLQAGATILSDTQGVDFSAYMRRLHNDVQRNWDPLIPEEVQPPLSKRGITGIRFTILPGGQIGAMTLETGSGDVALDRAAWNAITSEGNFPPLPREFHGPQLELRVGFFYNTPIPQ